MSDKGYDSHQLDAPKVACATCGRVCYVTNLPPGAVWVCAPCREKA